MRAYTMLTFLAAVTATEDTLCVGPGGAYPPNYFDMNFFESSLLWNNLGGMGPDTTQPASIRYANVGTYNGEQIDLVVVNTSALYRTPLAAPHRRRTH